MTTWINANTIETGWAGESEIIESRIKFNQSKILFNMLHVSFNGQVNKKFINILYSDHVSVNTAWKD